MTIPMNTVYVNGLQFIDVAFDNFTRINYLFVRLVGEQDCLKSHILNTHNECERLDMANAWFNLGDFETRHGGVKHNYLYCNKGCDVNKQIMVKVPAFYYRFILFLIFSRKFRKS